MPDEAQQVRAIVRGMEAATAKAVIRVSLDLTSNLIGSTPVDTGWARANWVPRSGAPFEGTNGEPGSSGAGAQATGQAEVAGFTLRKGAVYVTNNVPYIERLNEGYSPQASAGFVQRAIAQAVEQEFGDLETL